MTTCRDIVTLALRQARIVGIGRTPRASEAAEGMEALQALYDSMFSDGPLGPFTDVYKTENYTANENERVIADNITVTIPDTFDDEGETRAPKDLSAIVVLTSTGANNYVFSLGEWQVCNNLALDDAAPLANRDKAGLAALLAVQFAEMFGATLPPETTRRAYKFKGRISHKFSTDRGLPEYY